MESLLGFFDEQVVGIVEKRTELSKIKKKFRMDMVHTWLEISRVLNVVPPVSAPDRLKLI
jgi:hypothetical protein